MKLFDELNDEKITTRFKAAGRLLGYCYLGSQLFVFGVGLTQMPNTSPEASRLLIKYLNQETGPLSKIALFGYTAAHEINSFRRFNNFENDE